jgi:hypothetical protein
MEVSGQPHISVALALVKELPVLTAGVDVSEKR